MAAGGGLALPPPFSWPSVVTATRNFAAELRIGSGATGDVFRGELEGAPVAIKVLKVPEHAPPAARAELQRRFRAELGVLGAYRHARLVALRGYSEDEAADSLHPFALVFELLDGSLADYLRSPTGDAPARGPLAPLARVDVALGAAAGLAYLHGQREAGDGGPDAPVLHRDVKSANIGLAVGYAKLLDCGLAKAVRGGAAALAAAAGAAGASFTGGLVAGKRVGPMQLQFKFVLQCGGHSLSTHA